MEVLESQKSEINQLNDLVSQADEIVKEKEKEISWLNNLVHKDQLEIKVVYFILDFELCKQKILNSRKKKGTTSI